MSKLVALRFNPFAEPENYFEEIGSLEDGQYEFPRPATLIAESPNLPIGIFLQLCHDDDVEVRIAVARNETLPSSLLDALADDPNIFVREAVAANPSTCIATLAELAVDEDQSDGASAREASADIPHAPWEDTPEPFPKGLVRIAVANNPSIDDKLISMLSRDEEANVRKAIASRSDVGKDVQMGLAKDECHFGRRDRLGAVAVKAAIAKNPCACIEVLDVLAKDSDKDIRQSVASNPAATESVLSQLISDESWTVKEAVAGNPATSEADLCELATDFSCSKVDCIRIAVAKNPAATFSVFKALRMSQQGFSLGDYARRTSATPNSLPEPVVPRVRVYMMDRIAENPSLDSEMLRRFSEDSDSVFRVIAAQHRLTSDDALMRLAQDHDADVRRAVALNAAVPRSVAETMAHDSSVEVRVAFASSNSPYLDLALKDDDLSVLQSLASNASSNQIVLGRLATSDNESIRRLVAGNAVCPSGILDRLSTDKSEEVKCEVAANPSALPDTVGRLSCDCSLSVRIAVAKRHDEGIASVFRRLASEDDPLINDALVRNGYVPQDIRSEIVSRHDDEDPYDSDDDYDDYSGYDPADDPLYGWHFDEDNGWLDFYPED